jgi:hypothetical protein
MIEAETCWIAATLLVNPDLFVDLRLILWLYVENLRKFRDKPPGLAAVTASAQPPVPLEA